MGQTVAGAAQKVIRVAVAGNPNSGKTTIFNALTGLRLKVGNYPGVTVERREGRLKDDPVGRTLLVDLPGTYSLSARSLDERIARDVILGWIDGEGPPDAVIVVLDASNLERNCYLASQILELNLPTVLVCNMMDLAEQSGRIVDVQRLSEVFGAPAVATVGNHGKGIRRIGPALAEALAGGQPPRNRCRLAEPIERQLARVGEVMVASGLADERTARGAALLVMLRPEKPEDHEAYEPLPEPVERALAEAKAQLAAEGYEDVTGYLVERRYAWLAEQLGSVVQHTAASGVSLSEKVDHVVTHRLFGMAIFAAVMFAMFAGIFWLAEPVMGLVEAAVAFGQEQVRGVLPEGVLSDLLADGVIAGVGNVVVFFPQICMLFLFLAVLEDTGYMARAAFLMDRIMSRVGLHGKSFIPLLSGFACAVPAIMAARTIESRRDRLATILVVPLMSCAARLPVYLTLIALLLPREQTAAKATVMTSLYLLGVAAALLAATLLKKTLLRGPTPVFVMELPPYRLPQPLPVLRMMWDRSKEFLVRAGTFILAASVLLWAISYWPQDAELQRRADEQARQVVARAGFDPHVLDSVKARDQLPERVRAELARVQAAAAAAQIEASLAGRLGKWIEPVIRPLGYDWRIGVGILASFTAREVFVSTMGIVYSVGSVEDDTASLRERMQAAKWPDGRAVFSRATCLGLLVFYVLAMQCVSTLAVAWRETGSWRWPALMWIYMTCLAYGAAWLTYRAAGALGWGT